VDTIALKMFSIGQNILEGEIEAKQKNYDKAIRLVSNAMEIEDNLLYQEPPDWYHPSRQVLGAILLDAKKPALAEQRLYQSLQAQGKKNEAMEAKKEFDKAFAKSDINLKSVRY
jgi:hypothetical protein